VCGCDAQWVQQASGRQYIVCTRRSGAYVCVLCVRDYIPPTTTAEPTSTTDIAAGTDTDFVGACMPALTLNQYEYVRSC